MLIAWIAAPFAAALLAWASERWDPRAPRGVTLGASIVLFALALAGWAQLGSGEADAAALSVDWPWIPALGARFHLAADGLSCALVAMTALLGVAAAFASGTEIRRETGAFHGLLLSLVGCLVTAFLAADLLVFAFAWELMLLPKFLLIRRWGYGRRERTAWKLLIYGLAGGLVLLVAIVGLHLAHLEETGVATFGVDALKGTALAPYAAAWLLAGFTVGLGVKLPAVPLHGWLADAHADAPIASVIVGGAMMKAAGYAMLRFALPLFPGALHEVAPVACAVGVAGILYGAVAAFSQRDLRRMAAYGSLSHMGFALFGLFSGTRLAIQGAVVGLVAWGLASGAFFLVAEAIRARTDTLDRGALGGLWSPAPRLSAAGLFAALALLGLPGLATFAAEALVLFGAFPVHPWLVGVAALGPVLTAAWALGLVQDALHGPLRAMAPGEDGGLAPPKPPGDLAPYELLPFALIAALLVLLGLHPRPLVEAGQAAVADAVPGAEAQP